MLKYLRIAVTALGLTACVLLVALWVRSYWWVDAVYVAQTYSAGSMQGDMYVMQGFTIQHRLMLSSLTSGLFALAPSGTLTAKQFRRLMAGSFPFGYWF
jgi:hypothetical protein